jgi:hypothetical protein
MLWKVQVNFKLFPYCKPLFSWQIEIALSRRSEAEDKDKNRKQNTCHFSFGSFLHLQTLSLASPILWFLLFVAGTLGKKIPNFFPVDLHFLLKLGKGFVFSTRV